MHTGVYEVGRANDLAESSITRYKIQVVFVKVKQLFGVVSRTGGNVFFLYSRIIMLDFMFRFDVQAQS